MSDNGFDLIVYLVLTLGASVVGFLKSSKEKKAKTTPPVFHYPEEEEEEEEETIIIQQPETVAPHDTFIPVPQIDDALTEKLKKEKEVSISSFGRTDEERYAMLEKLQQSRRGRVKKAPVLFKEEEETSNEQQNNGGINDFDFDIRKAVISSEILNRKY